jgi:tRNA 5-methylaminomethyl-2-thiouridine biosynthesis bifunctional protein
MVLPAIDGVSVAGASFDLDDEDPAVRADSHEGNLERAERIVPGASRGLEARLLEGRTSFRTVARDRLPLVGALEAPGLYGAFAYGSRGLLWAGLAGELLASLMDGDPLPLEAPLAEALAPARFARRAATRRAGSSGSRPSRRAVRTGPC